MLSLRWEDQSSPYLQDGKCQSADLFKGRKVWNPPESVCLFRLRFRDCRFEMLIEIKISARVAVVNFAHRGWWRPQLPSAGSLCATLSDILHTWLNRTAWDSAPHTQDMTRAVSRKIALLSTLFSCIHYIIAKPDNMLATFIIKSSHFNRLGWIKGASKGANLWKLRNYFLMVSLGSICLTAH